MNEHKRTKITKCGERASVPAHGSLTSARREGSDDQSSRETHRLKRRAQTSSNSNSGWTFRRLPAGSGPISHSNLKVP